MRDDWPGALDLPSDDPSRTGRGEADHPRFCPGCSKPRPRVHSDLCPECGDRLEPQGYCAVCEGFWPIEAGAPCPKHDLPLDAARPEPVLALSADQPIEWVTVGAFPMPYQAEAARLRLDAEAIPAILDNQRMAAQGYHLITGGIRLQVPRAFAQDARILLSQNWSVPADDDEDDDDEDLDWDAAAPVRPEPEGWRSVLIFWGVVLSLVVVAGGLLGLIRA
jgi:hypothetical protein